MVRFLKAVNTFDKVTDCIPLVSTVKNVGILLYQLVHKVNRVNPVKTSWTDDIKIHALSKDSFVAKIASIPFVGNIVSFIDYVFLPKKRLFGPMGYLAEASRQWNDGCKKHGYEITALYLARNPQRSEKSLGNALAFAAGANSPDSFKLIFDSRTDWTAETVRWTIKSAKREADVQLILDKYKSLITDDDAGEIIRSLAIGAGEERAPIIKLLLEAFPNISSEYLGEALVRASQGYYSEAAFMTILEHADRIKQEHLDEALARASEKGFETRIEKLLARTNGSNVGIALVGAASRSHTEICTKLIDTYREKLTTEDIGKVLEISVRGWRVHEIGEKIMKEYQDLPGKDLQMALKRAANSEIEIFQRFLNHFSNIREEDVQAIFNEATLRTSDETCTFFSLSYAQVVECIRAKFPGIKVTGDNAL
ncbi:MAG: hypothetical protein JSR37_02475 [Verrucomicrobia bacterium]|nr:hypothetical protein [Verrucomicrobiota bacterium]MBS0637523.1 hypothetical protein [Verrucomicrobiota bacterium]